MSPNQTIFVTKRREMEGQMVSSVLLLMFNLKK